MGLRIEMAFFCLVYVALVSLVKSNPIGETGFMVSPASTNHTLNAIATFHCRAERGLSYAWKINDTTINPFSPLDGISVRTVQGDRTSVMTVFCDETRNMSRVVCVATLTDLTVIRSNKATLMIQGQLDKITNLSLHRTTNTSITLTWNPPFSLDITGVVPDFTHTVEVYNISTDGERELVNTTRNITDPSFTFSIVNPDPSDLFEFFVFAINAVGEGERSDPVNSRFGRDEYSLGDFTTSTLSTFAAQVSESGAPNGTVIGVVTVVVMIVGIIGIVAAMVTIYFVRMRGKKTTVPHYEPSYSEIPNYYQGPPKSKPASVSRIVSDKFLNYEDTKPTYAKPFASATEAPPAVESQEEDSSELVQLSYDDFLSKVLPFVVNVWKELGEALGLDPDDQIDEIFTNHDDDFACADDMLRNYKRCTQKELLLALVHIGKESLAKKLCLETFILYSSLSSDVHGARQPTEEPGTLMSTESDQDHEKARVLVSSDGGLIVRDSPDPRGQTYIPNDGEDAKEESESYPASDNDEEQHTCTCHSMMTEFNSDCSSSSQKVHLQAFHKEASSPSDGESGVCERHNKIMQHKESLMLECEEGKTKSQEKPVREEAIKTFTSHTSSVIAPRQNPEAVITPHGVDHW